MNYLRHVAEQDRISPQESLTECFNSFIEQQVAQHSALNHPLFHHLERLASCRKLTAKDFELFRHILFSRVYLTIPSITEALKAAVLRYDKDSIKTCYQNLSEELASEFGFFSHVEMMELAFNSIGKNIYNLPATKLRACFEKPRYPEELVYRYTARSLYLESPLAASLAQELSSGGLNTSNTMGMMSALYRVFLQLFLANRGTLKEETFQEEVLPYFKVHLTINNVYQIEFDGQGVEFNHGERAKHDYLRSVSSVATLQAETPYILAFLESQTLLFNRVLKAIKLERKTA